MLLKQKGVYNITDTVNGAFGKDALIAGERSDNALSVVGQGLADNSGRFVTTCRFSEVRQSS